MTDIWSLCEVTVHTFLLTPLWECSIQQSIHCWGKETYEQDLGHHSVYWREVEAPWLTRYALGSESAFLGKPHADGTGLQGDSRGHGTDGSFKKKTDHRCPRFDSGLMGVLLQKSTPKNSVPSCLRPLCVAQSHRKGRMHNDAAVTTDYTSLLH